MHRELLLHYCLGLDADQSEGLGGQVASGGLAVRQVPVHRLAHMSTVAADAEQAHQTPDSLHGGADLQTGDLHAGGGVQVAGGALALGEGPVSQQNNQVTLLLTLTLHEALAIDSHDLIALVEAGGLGELDDLGLQVHSGDSVVRELPVDRLGDVHVIGTNRLKLCRSERSLHNGAGKSTRDKSVSTVGDKDY